MRVVSLLPSATELLCAVGGRELLVGRSHECDFPPSIRGLPALTRQRTGGAGESAAEIDRQVNEALGRGEPLYELDGALLERLEPDVVLTQHLCEVCSIDLESVRRVARRMTAAPEIVSLDPTSIEEVFDDLLTVGEAVGRAEQARAALAAMRERYWSALDSVNPHEQRPEVAFLEWMDPLFAGGHWTPQLIEAAGGRHSLNPPGARSRQISPDELAAAAPQRLIICPCGYDLAAIKRELAGLRAQPWWSSLPAVADGAVVIVDGNQMFNRPGPRLVDALCWLVGWINDRPEVIPACFPAEPVA